MSIRFFCDVCNTETSGNGDRVRRVLGDVLIEVMVRYKETWNAGHVCPGCVLRVVTEGQPAGSDQSYVSHEARERQRSLTSVVSALPQNAA